MSLYIVLAIENTLCLEYRCHKILGTPENGDPLSPFSPVLWGPLRENGDPTAVSIVDFDCTLRSISQPV